MRLCFLFVGMLTVTLTFTQTTDLALLQQAYNENNPMKSLELIEQINDPESFDDSLKCVYSLTNGIAYGKLGKKDTAFFYLNQCLRQTNYEFLGVRAGNAKGLVLFQSGNYQEAVKFYQEALALAEKFEFKEEEATILGNMGGVYFQLDDFPSAIEYSKKSLDLAYSLDDSDDISYGHLRLAVTYEEIDSLEKSIFHNKQSSKFAEKVENYVLLTYIEKTLGNIHKKLERLDSSLYHHLRAREFAELGGVPGNVASTTNEIARIYLKQENLKKAEAEANYVLSMSKEKGYPHQIKLAYDILYLIALRKGDFEKALNNRNQYVIVNDSLSSIETKERIAELEIQYETAKKEKEIIEANAEIERQGRFQLFLIVVLLLSLVAIFLIIQRFRLRRALLSQEIDNYRIRISTIFSGKIDNLELSKEQIDNDLDKPLSSREYEILSLALSDKSNSEIAKLTGVSVSTIKFHLKNAYQKLGVAGRKEAMEFVINRNE